MENFIAHAHARAVKQIKFFFLFFFLTYSQLQIFDSNQRLRPRKLGSECCSYCSFILASCPVRRDVLTSLYGHQNLRQWISTASFGHVMVHVSRNPEGKLKNKNKITATLLSQNNEWLYVGHDRLSLVEWNVFRMSSPTRE